MPQQRLKSSFIYLANAVGDLRGNWSVLAIALAPMVLAAALCLLPDALNLQYRLAATFEPGSQTISLTRTLPADDDAPESHEPPARAPQPYPTWLTDTLHILFLLPSVLVTLLTLCALERIQSGRRAATIFGEAIEIYRRATGLAAAFLWVSFLQLVVPVTAVLLCREVAWHLPGDLTVVLYLALVSMIVLAALVYLWLYFAQFALIFGGRRSFHALLYSRDLMRKRFFKVAIRIVVFVTVWSGYNSWPAASFVAVSLIVGPVGAITGTLGTTIFLVDFVAIAVSFATAAFFVAAGLRLYQDLVPAPVAERAAPAGPRTM